MNSREKRILTRCALFRDIPEEALPRLLECLGAEEGHFEKNAMVWHAGDPVRACAVVLSGALRAEAVSAGGEKDLMAYHTPGSVVGDVLMATPGGVSPVYVSAAEETRLLFLPYRGIMGGCERNCPWHHKLRENLLGEIAGKFWMQRRRIGYLSARSLRKRIALYLMDQRQAQGSDTVTISGTREDLADLLGVNRSALCRELGRMKEEGLLDYYRNTLRILRPRELEEETDRSYPL